MAVTADHLIVIGRGRLIADCSTQEFIAQSSEQSVLVRSPDAARLAELMAAEGGRATAQEQAREDRADGQAAGLSVTGLEAPRIGEIAAANGIVLHELSPQRASLEEAYMELTADSSEYGAGRSGDGTGPASAGAAAAPAEPAPVTETTVSTAQERAR
jgi:ABC-2 type transport system ATP-binding protein